MMGIQRLSTRTASVCAAAIALATAVMVSAQSAPMSLRAGLLIDGTGETRREVRILVEDGVITRIDRLRGGVTHDLSELVLMPGWIDTHVDLTSHFEPDGTIHDRDDGGNGGDDGHTLLYALDNAYATVMSGFTTIRSLGDPRDAEIRAFLARGTIPGPRVLTSLQAVTAETGDPALIRVFVRRLATFGADVVKVLASGSVFDGSERAMSDAQIEAACSEATAQGLRAAVFAHGNEVVSAAVRAGCTSIEHGNQYDDDAISLMVEHGTYLDPPIGLLYRNYRDNRDAFVGVGNFTTLGFARLEQARGYGLDTFQRTLENPDVKVVFGSAAVAGAHGQNADELIARVRFGRQKPMAAIVSATSLAAASLGLGDEIGTVAPGFKADFVAVEGNPLEDIETLRNVRFVMRNGQVFRNDVRPVESRPSGRRRR